MRTTIDIDEDVLVAAKDLARAEGKSLGTVISELVRRAMIGGCFEEARTSFDAGTTRASTWPTLPGRQGLIVSPTAIEAIEDQLLAEDAAAALGAANPAAKDKRRG